MEGGYVYTCLLREFINSGETVIKVGMTMDPAVRIKQYPKGSIFTSTMYKRDPRNAEARLVDEFKKDFTQRFDIGKEYFEGDFDDIHNLFFNTLWPPDKPLATRCKVSQEAQPTLPPNTVIENVKSMAPSKVGRKRVPYTCPRCGYTTFLKADMVKHLYKKAKQCCGFVLNIDLTDDVKQNIMENRIYSPPVKV